MMLARVEYWKDALVQIAHPAPRAPPNPAVPHLTTLHPAQVIVEAAEGGWASDTTLRNSCSDVLELR